MNKLKNTLGKLSLIGINILLPALVCFAIPSILFGFFAGKGIFDYIPGVDNDEIHYWHEILTFSKFGFEGGYYTLNELPAPASFSHFGPHGPVFPILYGTIAHFFGWRPYSPLFFNALLVTGSLACFVYLIKPNNRQLILIGMTCSTFWPLILYANTVMQESLHQALGIVMAGCFYRLMKTRDEVSLKFKISCALVILVASLARVTWAFMIIPFYLLLAKKQLRFFKIVFLLLQSFFFILSIFSLHKYWSSPTNFFVNLSLEILLYRSLQNLVAWIGFKDSALGGIGSRFLGFIQRYQMLILSTYFLFHARYQKVFVSFIHLFVLGHMPVMLIIFYAVDCYRDYRVFAPYLLATLLILIPLKRNRIVRVIILTNLVAFPLGLYTYGAYHYHSYVYDYQSMIDFRKETKEFLIYQPESSPWCNTLLSSVYPSHLINVPAGIGISYIHPNLNSVSLPLKSKYVLLNKDYAQSESKLNIKYLNSTVVGDLYLNLDSNCGVMRIE